MLNSRNKHTCGFLTSILLNDLVDWTAVDEDNEDISVWEDNWDDDDVEDDFNQQLRYLLLTGIKNYSSSVCAQ